MRLRATFHSQFGLTLGLCILILFLAFVLRVYLLDSQSLWFDEGWSWYLAKLPLDQMAHVTAADRSPLLYYTLLHGWMLLAGESEFAMRFVSVCADVVTVALVIALSHTFESRLTATANVRLPLLAGLIYSACPLSIWYAQETRMYALVTALCMASSYWLWRWLRAPAATCALISTAALLALAVYAHYYAVFLLPAQGIAVLIWLFLEPKTKPRVSVLLRWLIAAAGVIAVLVPWLLFASIGFAYDDGFVFPLNTVSGRISEWIAAFANGGLPRPSPEWWVTAFCVAALAGSAGFVFARRWRQLCFALALIAGPLMAATIAVRMVYPYRSVFHPRYLIYVAPFACLLIAGVGVAAHNAGPSITERGHRWLPFGLRFVALVALALLWLPALNAYYTDPSLARDDIRDATRHVVEALAPGDDVVVTRDNYAVQYYLHRTYPEQAAAFISMPQGLHGILKSDADIVHALDQREPKRVRLFLWQDEVVDPQNMVESTLWANGYEIGELNFGQIRLPLYQVQRAPVQSLAFEPITATFGGQLELTAYWMRQQGRAGDWFYAVLLWRARHQLHANYKVFVHAWDANGRIVFQRDKLPLSNLLPMSSWTVGESMRDAYAMIIPATLPAGEYRIVVGVYDPTSQPSRLPVETSGHVVMSDALVLGTLQVHTR